MRIFAPTPFRYSSVDYPYGYQEIPSDTLAAAIVDAGLAFYDMPIQPQSNRLAPHLADHIALSTTVTKRFPTWPANTGILMSSLAASSTASRTSNVVTVTGTHGVLTGTTYVGFRFYYPGSASLAAGWYDSILSVSDSSTITFSAVGADFGSESINSGAAWTTATDAIVQTIAGNTLKDGSKVSVALLRDGDTSATTKTTSIMFGGASINTLAFTSSCKADVKQGFRCVGLAKQVAVPYAQESLPSSSAAMTILTKDMTADQTIGLRLTISAASSFIAVWGAHVEIVP